MGTAQSAVTEEGGEGAERWLLLEVLGGHFSDREYRVGDSWTIGVLGIIRPYVVVTFRGQEHRTGVIEMPLGCRDEIAANFDVRMDLPMPTSLHSLDPSASTSGDNTVNIAVRDKRYVQALLRGDPMVGEATLTLDRSASAQPQVARLDLFLPGSRPSGWLNVQYRILQVQVQRLRQIASATVDHPLLEVVRATVDMLQMPGGAEQLMLAKPRAEGDAAAPPAMQPARFRARVNELADALGAAAGSSPGTTDEDLQAGLKLAARKALVFVADFAWREGTGPDSDTVALAIQWTRNFFSNMGSVRGGEPQRLSMSRLERVLALASDDADDLVPVDGRGREVHVPANWNPGMRAPHSAILGEGAYGIVWRARDRSTKQLFAVKQMSLPGGVFNAVTERELSVAEHLLTRVAHPCVVKLLSTHRHAHFNCCSLVMEFCYYGDLHGQIAAGRRGQEYVTPRRALPWLAQIFLGLEYLHLDAGGMLVRDVKPQNVVIGRGMVAKLTDFGMSRLAATSDGTYSFHPCVPPGSPHFVAPEVLQGCGYDYRADLYSLGVLMWVLFTGGLRNAPEPMPPCANPGSANQGLARNWELLKAAILAPESRGARPLPSADARDLVLRLTDRSPEHPWMTHRDVREHPFLHGAELPVQGDTAAVAEWLERYNV